MPDDHFGEIVSLVLELNRASFNYWQGYASEMSDEVYDKKFARLRQLEAETGLVMHNSPTRRTNTHIAVDPVRPLVTEMPSYKRFYSKEELIRAIDGWAIAARPLYSGVRGQLVYRQGDNCSYLTDVLMRLDDKWGRCVYDHAEMIPDVPYTLQIPVSVTIPGTFVCSKTALESLELSVPPSFFDKRTAAHEALCSHSVDKVSAYEMRFIADYDCDLFRESGIDAAKVFEARGQRTGFVEQALDHFKSMPDETDALVDGVVFEHANGTHYAYMFDLDGEWTQINDVYWEVTEGGRLMPVAKIDTIKRDVAGVELISMDQVREDDIQIGDSVFVSDQVQMRIRNVGAKPIAYPTCCPECGSEIVERCGEPYCSNTECRPAKLYRLKLFCLNACSDLRRLLFPRLETLFNDYGIDSLEKLVKIDRDILKSFGLFDRQCDVIIEGLHLTKETPLNDALYSLAMPGITLKVAKRLTNHYSTLDEIAAAPPAKLAKIKALNKTFAQEIHDFLNTNSDALFLRKWLI